MPGGFQELWELLSVYLYLFPFPTKRAITNHSNQTSYNHCDQTSYNHCNQTSYNQSQQNARTYETGAAPSLLSPFRGWRGASTRRCPKIRKPKSRASRGGYAAPASCCGGTLRACGAVCGVRWAGFRRPPPVRLWRLSRSAHVRFRMSDESTMMNRRGQHRRIPTDGGGGSSREAVDLIGAEALCRHYTPKQAALRHKRRKRQGGPVLRSQDRRDPFPSSMGVNSDCREEAAPKTRISSVKKSGLVPRKVSFVTGEGAEQELQL